MSQGEGGGRPRKKIDLETVEKLASIMCTMEEIASYLGMSTDTMTRSKACLAVFKRGLDKGRMSVRRMQYKAAEDGNSVMMVWLGKQYLGQSDKNQTELTGRNGGAIEIDSPRERLERRIASIAARLGAGGGPQGPDETGDPAPGV
jgi:hypothetical protein